MAWIAEHLVDLLLQRVHTTTDVGLADGEALALIPQLPLLRDQARQAWLRAHRLAASQPDASSRSPPNPNPNPHLHPHCALAELAAEAARQLRN